IGLRVPASAVARSHCLPSCRMGRELKLTPANAERKSGKEQRVRRPSRGKRSSRGHHTASFAAFTGRALMIFRAGLALNTVGSLVNGLMPARSLVAGFLMTTNFAKPGSRKAPVFLSSL